MIMAGDLSDVSKSQEADALNEQFPYKEIYFLSLDSQSNIYCCSKLISADEESLIVGTLRGNVSCIKCDNGRNFCANAVYFTYIPGDAEIISMDAFSRIEHSTLPKKVDAKVIAISLALVKSIDGVKKHQHFLNIYKAMEPEQRSLLKDIARGCQHIELEFTPYQLTHTSIYSDGKSKENVFLLSGSDQKIHLFKENEKRQRFEEFPVEEFFPEFTALPSNVIWMDIKNCRGNIRMSALGCQNGFIKVAAVDSNSVILKCFTMDVAGLVTSVRLFPLQRQKSHVQEEGTEELSKEGHDCAEDVVSCEDLSLLVTCALELSVVYSNVYTCGFEDMVVLPKSDHFDSITCSAIADLDLNGENEIILGSYGQELLVYKPYRSSTQNDRISVHFDLAWTKSFPKPLFAIQTVGLRRGGLQELAVVSLNGVHILEFDVEKAAEKIIRRLTNTDLSVENDINEKAVRNEEELDNSMSPIMEER